MTVIATVTETETGSALGAQPSVNASGPASADVPRSGHQSAAEVVYAIASVNGSANENLLAEEEEKTERANEVGTGSPIERASDLEHRRRPRARVVRRLHMVMLIRRRRHVLLLLLLLRRSRRAAARLRLSRRVKRSERRLLMLVRRRTASLHLRRRNLKIQK
jgi:hypothetical protein